MFVTQKMIIEAIGKLDPNNKDHFTDGGLPQVKAIEDVLGKNISGKDRDKAWAAYQKQNKASEPGPQEDHKEEEAQDAKGNQQDKTGDSGGDGVASSEGDADKPSENTDAESDGDAADSADELEQENDPDPAEVAEYEVISPLQRDGKRYEIGDPIELVWKDAEPLLKHTIKRPVKGKPESF